MGRRFGGFVCVRINQNKNKNKKNLLIALLLLKSCMSNIPKTCFISVQCSILFHLSSFLLCNLKHIFTVSSWRPYLVSFGHLSVAQYSTGEPCCCPFCFHPLCFALASHTTSPSRADSLSFHGVNIHILVLLITRYSENISIKCERNESDYFIILWNNAWNNFQKSDNAFFIVLKSKIGKAI